MFYKAKEFTLKNGIKVTLKSPEISDAQKMIDCIIDITRTTDYMNGLPEDYQVYLDDIKKEEAFLEGHNSSDNNYMIAVFYKDIIIGSCALNFGAMIKTKHRGTIGIGIRKEYRGLGLGSILFDEIINIAKNREGATQLELGVIKDNIAAKRLYTSKGFVKTGETPRALRLPNGVYLDEEFMVLYLDKQ